MAQNVKGITIEIGGETTGFQKALKGLNSEVNKTQRELNEVNKALKLDPKNTELVSQKQQLLAKATEETKTKLNALKSAKEQADKDMANGTEVNQEQYRKLQREIVAAENNIKSLDKETKDLGTSTTRALNNVGDNFDKIGSKIENAGKKLIPISVGIAAVGGTSTKLAIDFENAMAKVSTIADETKVPLKTLEQSILDLSDQTGISANLIAEDVYNAISAGQDTADAVNFVANSTKLAKAGFAESSQSLDILTTIMNSYGLEAEKVGEVSDILIQIQNKGKTTVADLSANMGKAIPTAKANKVGLDQLGASYAIMTSKGIATAETTTYLNSMMNELGKSGTKSSNILKEQTGKSFGELMESGKSLADVLAIVDDGAKKNNLSMADMFGSAEAGKAGLILLGDGVDTFNTSVKDMQNSTGATDEAFEKLQTTSEKAKIAIEKLKNTGIKLGQSILQILAPVLERVAGKIKELTEKFNNLSDRQKETIIKIGLLVAAIAPALIAVGKLLSSIKLVTTALSFLVANPIALAIVGITALAVAIGVHVAKSKEETEAMKKARKEHEAITKPIEDNIKAYQDLKKATDDSMNAGLSEVEVTKSLWNELQTLADENGNVKESNRIRAEFITGELSKAMGKEIEMVDGQIQGYKDLTKEMEIYLAKKQGQTILDSRADKYASDKSEYNNTAQESARLEKEIALQLQKTEDLKKRFREDAIKAADDFFFTQKYDATAEERAAYIERLAKYYQNESREFAQAVSFIGDSSKTLQENNKKLDEQLQEITQYENLQMAVFKGTAKDIQGEMAMFNTNLKTASNSTKDILKQQYIDTAIAYTNLLTEFQNGNDNITQEQVNAAQELARVAETEFLKAGGAIPESIANGINAKSSIISEQTGKIKSDLINWANGTKTEIDLSFNGFISGLTSKFGDLKQTFSSASEALLAGNGPINYNNSSSTNSTIVNNNFYSPKPLTPYETARLNKNATNVALMGVR